jgi:hypothetical protein
MWFVRPNRYVSEHPNSFNAQLEPNANFVLEHVVGDLRAAAAYLRKVGDWDRVFGSWKELTSQVRT